MGRLGVNGIIKPALDILHCKIDLYTCVKQMKHIAHKFMLVTNLQFAGYKSKFKVIMVPRTSL